MDPQTPIEGAIFDVDGTLIDSVDYHAKAWVETLRDYGHSVAFEAVRKQIGKGGGQLMKVFLSRQDLAAYGEDLEAHRGRILKKRYLSVMTAFPSARQLFQRLIADGSPGGRHRRYALGCRGSLKGRAGHNRRDQRGPPESHGAGNVFRETNAFRHGRCVCVRYTEHGRVALRRGAIDGEGHAGCAKESRYERPAGVGELVLSA
jgi:hypothetical protein